MIEDKKGSKACGYPQSKFQCCTDKLVQAPTAPVFPAQRCKHSLCATEANLPCLHQNLHLLLLPACRNQATLSAIAQQLSALEKSQPAAPTALSALLGPSALLCPHWVAQSLLSPTTSGHL